MKQGSSDGYIVLITVLILGVIVTTTATFLLITSQNTTVSTTGVKGGVGARAAAIGCANLALGAIQNNPTLSTPSSGSATIDPTIPETCTYNITGSSPNYTIVVSGTVNQGKNTYLHNLTITTSAVTPQINIASWQDTQ